MPTKNWRLHWYNCQSSIYRWPSLLWTYYVIFWQKHRAPGFVLPISGCRTGKIIFPISGLQLPPLSLSRLTCRMKTKSLSKSFFLLLNLSYFLNPLIQLDFFCFPILSRLWQIWVHCLCPLHFLLIKLLSRSWWDCLQLQETINPFAYHHHTWLF